MKALNTKIVHTSWKPIFNQALHTVPESYLNNLCNTNNWLPGAENIFNAFSLPLTKIQHILIGESPYPRPQSANGYAFWDNAVQDIWADFAQRKLSKPVNKATSLRNFIKMLLKLDPEPTIKTLPELFTNLLNQGFLLLNASLVYSDTQPVKYHSKHWQNFIKIILDYIYTNTNPKPDLLLFGKIAHDINKLDLPDYQKIIAEHPYNLSFINNPVILNYFKNFHLLYSFNSSKFK